MQCWLTLRNSPCSPDWNSGSCRANALLTRIYIYICLFASFLHSESTSLRQRTACISAMVCVLEQAKFDNQRCLEVTELKKRILFNVILWSVPSASKVVVEISREARFCCESQMCLRLVVGLHCCCAEIIVLELKGRGQVVFCIWSSCLRHLRLLAHCYPLLETIFYWVKFRQYNEL